MPPQSVCVESKVETVIENETLIYVNRLNPNCSALDWTIRKCLNHMGHQEPDSTAVGCVVNVTKSFTNILRWFPGLPGRLWEFFYFQEFYTMILSVHILFISAYNTCAWVTGSDGGALVIYSLWCHQERTPWRVALCGASLEMDEAFSLGSAGFCAVVLGNLYSVTALQMPATQ